MPKWTDFGNFWATLREVDVSAIRAEADRPVVIACVGHVDALDTVSSLLHAGADRYGPVGIEPLEMVPLAQVAERANALRGATMLVVCVDTRTPLVQREVDSFSQIERLSMPALVVLIGGATLPAGVTLPRAIAAASVVIPDQAALDAPDKLASAVLDRLPAELQLSAARRLAGLRNVYVRELVNSSSVTNATYAFASSIPEQIPVLSVPFAVTDMIVLTKNQAIMVYRMALAFGAPPDFQNRIVEIAPVIGGGFVWRQVARSLVGMIPIWGIIPKVAISYSGTYVTGIVAWRWFAYGEILSAAQVRKITAEAMGIGRTRAKELIEQARKFQPKKSRPADTEVKLLTDEAATDSATGKPSLLDRVRAMLPGKRA